MLVNQKVSSGGWFKLLTTNFNAGTSGKRHHPQRQHAGRHLLHRGWRSFPRHRRRGIATCRRRPIEIVASDAVAGEFATNTARFAIVRSGDTNPAVTVNYSISGTATNGVDYATLPTSVTLASGAMATNIIVTPIPDNCPEGDRTVTLTLLPSANYALTTVSNATVVIHDRPIDAWRLASFTTAELADPSISGDLADPDHDGLSNLMEYALGLPPKAPTATNRPYASVATGYLTLTYTRAKAATDVSLVVEQSDDLATWHSGTNYVQQLSVVDQGGAQLITVQTVAPVSSSAANYVRLRATRLP